MHRKPWPIVILAFLHLMEPVLKLGFYSWLWSMPLGSLIKYLSYQASIPELALFVGAFPLAGLAILAMKRWSLPAFVGMQVLTLSGLVYFHLVAPKSYPMFLLVGLSVSSLLVVTYFLLPAVRLAYMDPSVRWWEAKPRFVVDWAARILQGKKTHEVSICDVSEGGMLLQVGGKSAALSVNEPVQVEFEAQGISFSLPGVVRHYSASAQKPKYGIQFSEITHTTLMQLRAAIRQVSRDKKTRKGDTETAYQSFSKWATTLAKTGKGLVPEVKKPGGKKTQLTVPAIVEAPPVAEKPRKRKSA